MKAENACPVVIDEASRRTTGSEVWCSETIIMQAVRSGSTSRKDIRKPVTSSLRLCGFLG
jgi:hypothetical protein